MHLDIKKNIVWIIICVFFIVSIIPIMYLAFYSRPCVDDYNYSIYTHELVSTHKYNVFQLIGEAFKTDIKFYNSWQGLYSSAFILSLQPGIFGEQYYWIGAWILIALMYGCLYFFIKTILKDILKINQYTFLTTTTLFSIILMGLPSAVQGIYWYNGAWNYMPFLFLTLVNISLVLRTFYLNKKYDIIFSTILSFIISGGNHVTAFLNIMILVIFNVCTLKKSKKGILPLVTAIIGFVIMFIAPGTSIRQNALQAHGVIDTIIKSAGGYILYSYRWFSIKWVIAIIEMIPLAHYIKKKNNLKKSDLKYHPLLLFMIKVILICGMFCVPYKAMGNLGADRVKNVIWITYLILSCVWWTYFDIWLSFRMNLKHDFSKYYKALLLLGCLGIILLGKSNFKKAITSIYSGSASSYALCCDERYDLMKQSNEDTIYVEELPHDEMLYFDDITSDINDWRNIGWKNYYGKDIIKK